VDAAAAVKFSIEHTMDPATKSGMRSVYEAVHSIEPCLRRSRGPFRLVEWVKGHHLVKDRFGDGLRDALAPWLT
jgi:hypothetical protein